jgi:hypothetical protein
LGSEEKKYPAVCGLPKRLGMTVGGKVHTGPRPYEGDVESLIGQALRPRTMRWVTNSSEKGEREDEKGRRFFVGSAKREPERTKSPREQGSHLGLNLQGAEIRLFSWD